MAWPMPRDPPVTRTVGRVTKEGETRESTPDMDDFDMATSRAVLLWNGVREGKLVRRPDLEAGLDLAGVQASMVR